MKKDVILQIRISREEREQIKKIAEENHTTVSNLIRTIILALK